MSDRVPKPGEVWTHPEHGNALAHSGTCTYLDSARGSHVAPFDGWSPAVVLPEPLPGLELVLMRSDDVDCIRTDDMGDFRASFVRSFVALNPAPEPVAELTPGMWVRWDLSDEVEYLDRVIGPRHVLIGVDSGTGDMMPYLAQPGRGALVAADPPDWAPRLYELLGIDPEGGE